MGELPRQFAQAARALVPADLIRPMLFEAPRGFAGGQTLSAGTELAEQEVGLLLRVDRGLRCHLARPCHGPVEACVADLGR